MLCGGRYDDVLIMYVIVVAPSIYFFFFNDTATTEIYTLSLHDALPICVDGVLEFEDFAFDIDGDFFGEVPICHSGGDRSDVADLAGQVTGHRIDRVGQILPGAGDVFDVGPAAEFAFGADFARDAGDFGGEGTELVHHRVDGVLQFQDFALRIDGDLLGHV